MHILNDSFFRRVAGAALFGLFTYILFRYVLGLVSPFLAAYLMSVVVGPLARFLEHRGLSRGFTSVLGMACFFLGAAIISAAFLGNVWQQAVQFTTQIPAFMSELQATLEELVQSTGLYDISTPIWLSEWVDTLILNATQLAQNSIGDGVATTSLSFFRSLPAFVIWIIMFILSSFFLIKDKDAISKNILRVLPQDLRIRIARVREGLATAFWGYLRAQGMIMTAIATISTVALMFRGYPYALFMGILIALLDFLPIVGSGTILIPWSILSFATGNTSSAIYFLVLWGINFLTRQFLEPKLISSQIGLHPLLTIMSIYIGLRTLGPLGVIAGPIWIMTLKISLQND